MSFYATIQGELTYPTAERLQEVVISLRNDKYMEGDKFVDECGQIVEEDTPSDIDELTLHIPLFHYRNLALYLDEIVKESQGVVVWTSTDGCFEGGTYIDGAEAFYSDLKDWAAENMPEEDADAPDINTDFENWCIWSSDVEQAFHDEMMEWN